MASRTTAWALGLVAATFGAGPLMGALAACAPKREVPAGMVRYDTPENGERLKRVVGNLARANVDLCRGSTVG